MREPWQDRVIIEADALREKIEKLLVALLSALVKNAEAYDLLVLQLEQMIGYYVTLCRRIRTFL